MRIQILFLLVLVLVPVILTGCSQVEPAPATKTVTPIWTATGDDGIQGQAVRYDGRVAFDRDSLLDHFTACRQWPGIDTLAPAPALTAESFTCQVLVMIGDTTYFAIRAVDDANNWSNISNIATIFWDDDLAPAAILDLDVAP